MSRFLKWFYALPEVGKGDRFYDKHTNRIMTVTKVDANGVWLSCSGTRGFWFPFAEIRPRGRFCMC